MTLETHSRSIAFALTVAVFLGCAPAWAGDLSMKEQMEILTQPRSQDELGTIPSIEIDEIHASVPLDDRMNADAAFNAPFTASLREGLTWYLRQRGLKIVETGADLRCTTVIESYEGFKGWGHWGVDVHFRVKLFRGSQVIVSEDLRSLLKYSDDEDVVNEEKPKYDARNLDVTFAEILFTRVGVDLSEKFITLLKEKAPVISAPGGGQLQNPAASRGRLSIDSTVPNSEVFIDGKLVGTTPIADLPLPATTHSIEIRKRGYLLWQRDIAVIEGAASHITAELEAENKK